MSHKKTSAYLLLSIMAFMICPFLGIISLYHALKARNLETANNEQYEHELDKTFKWARNSILTFLSIWILLVIYLIVLYEMSAFPPAI